VSEETTKRATATRARTRAVKRRLRITLVGVAFCMFVALAALVISPMVRSPSTPPQGAVVEAAPKSSHTQYWRAGELPYSFGVVESGRPDGEGRGLFWLRDWVSPFSSQSEPNDLDSFLIELPSRKVLYRVHGFQAALWAPDGTVVAVVATRKPGIGLFAAWPLLRRLKPIRPYYVFSYWRVDLASGKFSRLPRRLRPGATENVLGVLGEYSFQPRPLPNISVRGDLTVSCDKWKDPATGAARKRVNLTDAKTGTARVLFEFPWRSGTATQPFFTDDDTVMFGFYHWIVKVTLSTGKAEQLYPLPVDPTRADYTGPT